MTREYFSFDSVEIVSQTQIDFRYSLGMDSGILHFTESVTLPQTLNMRTCTADIGQILKHMHIALGMSYWKLRCPPEMMMTYASLSQSEAAFWDVVYTRGLGEFYFRNQIDFRGLVHFPADGQAPVPVHIPTTGQSLVAIGGGKDSLVTVELLRSIQKQSKLFHIDTQRDSALIQSVIAATGIESYGVRRTLDPQVFTLSKQPGFYDGHVPISVIYALTGLLLGALGGYRYIITSNERSSNYGNTTYLGYEINHQWSKTAEFEKLFCTFVHQHITPDITYFSLLRPWFETKIVAQFAKFPQYFSLFSSCNTNFKTDGKANASLWCGICSKCLFVYTLLAAYIPKTALLSIFKKDLFNDNSLQELFLSLLGMKGMKPFECVGTPEEMRDAVHRVVATGAFRDAILIRAVQEYPALLHPYDAVHRTYEAPGIPPAFRELVSTI